MFGYDSVVGTPSRTSLKPLVPRAYGELNSNGGGAVILGRNNPDAVDPTAPDLNNSSEAVRQAIKDHTGSLGDLITLLNKQVKERARNIISAELSGKTVMYSGTGNSPPARIAEALAEMYGFPVRHSNGGGITIERAVASPLTGYADINPAVLVTIPGSIRRYAEARLAELHGVAILPPNDKQKSLPNYRQVGLDLERQAFKQIREVAESLASKQKTQKITVSQLPMVSQRAFVLSQCSDAFLAALKMCDHDFPPYILDFDHSVLVGNAILSDAGIDLTIGIQWTDPSTGSIVRSSQTTTIQNTPTRVQPQL